MPELSPQLKDYLLPNVRRLEEFHRKNFLFLEGQQYSSYYYPDTYMALSLSHRGKDWHDAHTALHAEGFQMLTPRQFVDFINLLKSGKAFDGKGDKISPIRLEAVLREIIAPKAPLRGEWLNALFKEKLSSLFIYEKYSIDGRLVLSRGELLYPHLAQNREIDWNDYLRRATSQGLPEETASPRRLNRTSCDWLSPCNGSVMRFSADANGICLDSRVHTSELSVFSVRRACAKYHSSLF